MDESTWNDPSVVTWVNQHAIAVQVDVDEQPRVAGPLEVTTLPAVLVFQGDREVDRLVGYRTPAELLSWLDRVRLRVEGDKRVTQPRTVRPAHERIANRVGSP